MLQDFPFMSRSHTASHTIHTLSTALSPSQPNNTSLSRFTLYHSHSQYIKLLQIAWESLQHHNAKAQLSRPISNNTTPTTLQTYDTKQCSPTVTFGATQLITDIAAYRLLEMHTSIRATTTSPTTTGA
jgi:hypothetical protein